MRLGIDLGGTKIAAIVLDDRDRVIWENRIATPRNYDGTIDAILQMVARGEQAAGQRCSVGLGIPGAVSPATDLIKNANSTWLNGRPLHVDLKTRLGRDVRLANDANCLAVSEAADGAAAGAPVVFAVILGTGVGGGLAINGEAVAGANAIAGEWGHNPLPWPEDDERPGPVCYCGRTGCIETFVSGPGLAADYARRSGVTLPAEAVAQRAQQNDPIARKALDVWTERLARSLAAVINVLDPDVIVAAGGLSNIGSIYTNVPALWQRWVFSDRVVTPFVQARHGDASGVRGAARLWPHSV